MSRSDFTDNPLPPRSEFDPYEPVSERMEYEDVPWYRRNGFCSSIVVAHVLVMVLGSCVPFVSLLGFFTTIGVIVVCVVVLTGPVYYNRRRKDGTLAVWSAANKVAAVILLVLFVGGYGALVYYLLANAKMF